MNHQETQLAGEFRSSQEATDDWTKRGTEERCSGKDRHPEPTLIRSEDIEDRPA